MINISPFYLYIVAVHTHTKKKKKTKRQFNVTETLAYIEMLCSAMYFDSPFCFKKH